MSHLISIELDDEIAKRILKDLQNLSLDEIENSADLIFAIEEAIDSDDG